MPSLLLDNLLQCTNKGLIWPNELANYNTHHRIFQLTGYPLSYFPFLLSKILSYSYSYSDDPDTNNNNNNNTNTNSNSNKTKNKPFLMWRNGMIGSDHTKDIWFWIEIKQLESWSPYRLSSKDRTIVELKVRGLISQLGRTTAFFRWMCEMIRCQYIRYQIEKMEVASFVLPKSVIPCQGKTSE